MTNHDRRTFLRRAGLAGAAGAAVAMMPGVARPQPVEDDCLAPFFHGVSSGDPTADGVILWTRVRDADQPEAPVQVTWRVATDVDLSEIVASGATTASAARDHTVKVDVAGLEPGTHYFYDFEALGARSLVGRTKTAPDTGAEHLRFGVVSCSNFQHGYFNAYARLAERDDLDAILHLGDYVYEIGPGEYGDVRDHEPPEEMTTLEAYRGRYGQYKLDPDLRRLHQLFPFVTTWDDHESTDNSWRDGALNHTPGAEGAWSERKAWSQQAYDEWMPIRSAAPDRIYRTLRYGDLCDLIVLDTRLEGRDEQLACFDPGCTVLEADIDDPDRRLISESQMSWFQDQLSDSQKRGTAWRIVCQQVCVGQWNLPGLPESVLGIDRPDAPGLVRSGGNALNPDSWDGYTADRNRFLDHVRDQDIDNLVVLTGDVHSSWAMELTRNPADIPYAPLGVEFVAPAVTSGTLGEALGPGAPLFELVVNNPLTNPHIKYLDSTSKGYVVLDVTPARVQADWFYVDTVIEPSINQTRGASWIVDDGVPQLRQVPAAAPDGEPSPAIPDAEPAVCAGATSLPTTPTTTADGSPDLLPSTGPTTSTDGLALPVGAALGAAALAHVLRRRAEISSPTDPRGSRRSAEADPADA